MELERVGDVAVLTMNAGKANAVGPMFLEGLDAMLAELERSTARAAVLIGYDRFFSAGLDLVSLVEFDRPAMGAFMAEFHRVFRRIYGSPLPVVAAVNGHAIAGGCVLALQADWRILAQESSRMGLNETQLGVGLPSIVLESLRWRLPFSSWMPVALEGGIFEPERALELGLVDALAPAERVRDEALEKASSLAQIPAEAWAQVKLGHRQPALSVLDGNNSATDEAWLNTWFAPETRKRVGAAVERLSR